MKGIIPLVATAVVCFAVIGVVSAVLDKPQKSRYRPFKRR